MAVGKTLETNKAGLASDMNTLGQWGLASTLPATEDVVAGSFFYETDTKLLKQEQNGSWIDISGADLSTTDAVVGDVKSGKTFFAAAKPIKTGTLATRTLSPANETVQDGYYEATTLSAVDADLAVGNIKKDVNIFGKVGTYQGVLAEDVSGTVNYGGAGTTTQAWINTLQVSAGSDVTIVTDTRSYDATAMVVASGWVNAGAQTASTLKIRLYMDGVQMAESGYIGPQFGSSNNYTVIGIRALAGSKICYIAVHNYAGSTKNIYLPSLDENQPAAAAMSVGSVKLT